MQFHVATYEKKRSGVSTDEQNTRVLSRFLRRSLSSWIVSLLRSIYKQTTFTIYKQTSEFLSSPFHLTFRWIRSPFLRTETCRQVLRIPIRRWADNQVMISTIKKDQRLVATLNHLVAHSALPLFRSAVTTSRPLKARMPRKATVLRSKPWPTGLPGPSRYHIQAFVFSPRFSACV